MDTKPIGRRMFLGLGAIGAGTLLFGHAFGGGGDDAGQDSFFGDLIGRGGFRIYTVAPIPKFDPATWKLEITGLVDKPIKLTYDDLLGMAPTIQDSVFHCVTGWSVANLTWQGVSLQSIVDLAKPLVGAKALLFFSSDGAYTDSLTLGQATKSDVILAYNMNGKALPLDQGMPIRLLVPEMYGYKSVKWVNKIEFAPKPVAGYWEVRGYDVDAYLGR